MSRRPLLVLSAPFVWLSLMGSKGSLAVGPCEQRSSQKGGECTSRASRLLEKGRRADARPAILSHPSRQADHTTIGGATSSQRRVIAFRAASSRGQRHQPEADGSWCPPHESMDARAASQALEVAITLAKRANENTTAGPNRTLAGQPSFRVRPQTQASSASRRAVEDALLKHLECGGARRGRDVDSAQSGITPEATGLQHPEYGRSVHRINGRISDRRAIVSERLPPLPAVVVVAP